MSVFGAVTAAEEKDYAGLTREILEKLTQGAPLTEVSFRLWDGSYWPDAQPKAATLVLHSPGALKIILGARSEVGLGEAYLHDIFDVEGDLEAAFEFGDLLAQRSRGWTALIALGALALQLPQPNKRADAARGRAASLSGEINSPGRDREAIQFHYDLSNAFYALWLDSRMVYSCAYFADEQTGLEEAQRRKLDLICRKLDLQRGQRLLDIGSGWGGLIIHAATKYGVKADGITLSQNQLEWTRRLIAEQGLEDRVTVRLLDYREMEETDIYDRIVSVGMVEHVGEKVLPGYFRQVHRLLRTGGLFLNHGIGLGPFLRNNEGESFIQHYVFPDSSLVSIEAMLRAAEGWEIRDVDSLREHYAMTLRHWVSRLEAHHAEALREIDETAYRTWRLYMAGSAHGFRVGYLSLYQTLLAKIDGRGLSSAPLTREGWYR